MSIADWIPFFASGWGAGFTVYTLLQAAAALMVRRKDKLLILIPAPFMLGVLLWTIYAQAQESNLWPIVMIFASPPAAIAVVFLWFVSVVNRRRR